MIPSNSIEKIELIENIQFDKSYKMQGNRIQGNVYGLEALKQALSKRLLTEKYIYPIYSFDYGVDWNSWIGKDIDYVKIELKRLVKEALMLDSRVIDVTNFDFKFKFDELSCSFEVFSIYGNITITKEVNI